MSPEAILKVYEQGPEAVIGLVQKLTRTIQTLEGRLNQNSQNSSKPPSSDGYRKPVPKSLRPTGERKPGGQFGHVGHTLAFNPKPDHVERRSPDVCSCGCSLVHQPVVGEERRQVHDLPPIVLETTEYIVEEKHCPACGKRAKGHFPEEVTAPVQYGPRVRSIASYFNQYQLLPYQRTREVMSDLFEVALSGGTLYASNRRLHEQLEPMEQQIKDYLIGQPTVHFDETGLRVDKKLHWCHVACTDQATYYSIQSKRGHEGSSAAGILPQFRGNAMHDGLTAYGLYENCLHRLCNAHHQRELVFLYEQEGLAWAKDMIELLVEGKKQIEATGQAFSKEEFSRFRTRFHTIRHRGIRQDERLHPPQEHLSKKRGKRKQSKAKNLLDRLKDSHAVLGYLQDTRVPYDNNQAERDLRMMKVQQKVSGCFRRKDGADMFARIRGCVSTAKKQGKPILAFLRNTLTQVPQALFPQ